MGGVSGEDAERAGVPVSEKWGRPAILDATREEWEADVRILKGEAERLEELAKDNDRTPPDSQYADPAWSAELRRERLAVIRAMKLVRFMLGIDRYKNRPLIEQVAEPSALRSIEERAAQMAAAVDERLAGNG